MLNDVEVGVLQDSVFDIVIFGCEQICKVQLLFFTKVIEYGVVIWRAGVKGTFDWLRRAIVVLHVVWKNHQLSDVDKTSEPEIPETFNNAVALSQNTFRVVRFFDLNKYQRHAVYKQDDIWSKFIIAVFVSQFGDYIEAVVGKVGKVDKPWAWALGEFIVKGFAKVLVIKRKLDVIQQTFDVIAFNTGVNAGNGLSEKVWEDVGIFIPNGIFEG